MAIKIKLQVIRKDTKYESYRVTLPRALIKAHDLSDKDFDLEFKNGKIVLTPVKKTNKG
ncbi:AbrB/MazE/SpoVT family DNA-binding domain-containing protein [Candidatus Pacearchaeota archaeon]|nr:AbrB/MazE/SpoVT family DNA-binding domain-containing protein [Candidatus Pacearchaeota archaeon]